MAEDEELDLRSLGDPELAAQMHDDLYDGLAEEIHEGTSILLERGWSPQRVLDEALVEGMRIVGIDFRDGILFVPEVLLSANAMKAGMAILRPLLAETGAEPVGKVVIGTVKGAIGGVAARLGSFVLLRSSTRNGWGYMSSIFISIKLVRQKEEDLNRFAKAISKWEEVLECS